MEINQMKHVVNNAVTVKKTFLFVIAFVLLLLQVLAFFIRHNTNKGSLCSRKLLMTLNFFFSIFSSVHSVDSDRL